ncbi:amino acid ABC transporter permease [Alysiella crassa]|uniref:Putative glutamine transport system permease protein GlnP n=1 Tax=Alysiella crassa TaxID=153491 RepID=A0A376BLL3_9NEIS|nr:amino acid ABC transporter permease [Alysiella crassa]UOP07185.1 amino acid ABC transporter permease [Alysiella crassa]SSY70652.1 Glutamine transport system permease protein glnP [Alysiella crassa]
MEQLFEFLKGYTDFRFDIIWEYRHMFRDGALMTLKITAIAIFFGTILGLLGALARIIRLEKGGIFAKAITWVLRNVSLLYVTLFRGTPLFVQIFIWHFVWSVALINPNDGLLISSDLAAELRRNYGALIAGVLALTFNAGAYITEIFRAGIQSIDKGQMEAARSLGLTYAQAMRFVILPQALRRMLPPIANEFITLLKDSSLVSAIAVAELAYVQKTISGRYSIYEEPLYTIALIYLLMTLCLSWLFSWLEKKYNPQHHH